MSMVLKVLKEQERDILLFGVLGSLSPDVNSTDGPREGSEYQSSDSHKVISK